MDERGNITVLWSLHLPPPHTVIKCWVIYSLWSMLPHCWKNVFWRVLETFPPAGTQFNEQQRWIIIHIKPKSHGLSRDLILPFFTFSFRGRRLLLVESDSLKSQSCILGRGSVQLIRQTTQLNCVLLLDLYSNNDNHLHWHLWLFLPAVQMCVGVTRTNIDKVGAVACCITLSPCVLCVFVPDNRNSIAASAVCAFNLSAISQVFNGPFKYQENSRSAWLPYPNPNPDFQVKTTHQVQQIRLYVKYKKV